MLRLKGKDSQDAKPLETEGTGEGFRFRAFGCPGNAMSDSSWAALHDDDDHHHTIHKNQP